MPPNILIRGRSSPPFRSGGRVLRSRPVRLFPAPQRFPPALDRLVTRVAGEHLPRLVGDLLPYANKVAGLIPVHDFGALLFEDRDYRLGIGALPAILALCDRPEGCGHAIE